MERKKSAAAAPLFSIKGIILFFAYLGIIAYQYYNIFVDGIYSWARKAGIGKEMIIEILISAVFVVLTCFYVKSKTIRWIFLIYFILVAAYLHQTLLPLGGSAIYFVAVYLIGYLFFSLLAGSKKISRDIYMISSLLLGLCAIIIIVALLSAFRIYSVHNALYVIIALSIICLIIRGKNILAVIKEEVRGAEEENVPKSLFQSVAVISFIIQVARVGAQCDYDGRWYGLRSSYVLAPTKRGIYENLKLVGFTYLYPKGGEIILLPLSKFKSWNYQFLFNAFLVLAVTYIAWSFIKRLSDEKKAYIITSVIVTLPSLMNMAMTVKPDVITVLFQLSGIYLIYRARKDKNDLYVYIAVAVLIVSYAFKMTTLLFTSSIVLALIPFVPYKSIRRNASGIIYLLIGIITLGFVWGRNVVLAGFPLLFYVGKIASSMGIKLKYPYSFNDSLVGDANMYGSVMNKLLTNLKGYFILPVGDNFHHVIIAWGTTLPVILLIIAALLFIFDKNRFKYYKGWLWFSAVLTISMLFGFLMIGQADGNYFLIFYIMFIIIFGSYIFRRSKDLVLMIALAVIFNIYFVLYTNWSWAYGFTDIAIRNPGYVNQVSIYDDIFRKKVGKKVYNTIHDPDAKVLAVTWEVSDLIAIHGVSELWIDVERGNQDILKDYESFYDYLYSSGFRYIYMDPAIMTLDRVEMQYMTGLVDVGAIKNIKFGKGGVVMILNDKLEDNQEKEDEQIQKICEYIEKKHSSD